MLVLHWHTVPVPSLSLSPSCDRITVYFCARFCLLAGCSGQLGILFLGSSRTSTMQQSFL